MAIFAVTMHTDRTTFFMYLCVGRCVENPEDAFGEYIGLMKMSPDGRRHVIKLINELRQGDSLATPSATEMDKWYLCDLIQRLVDEGNVKVTPLTRWGARRCLQPFQCTPAVVCFGGRWSTSCGVLGRPVDPVDPAVRVVRGRKRLYGVQTFPYCSAGLPLTERLLAPGSWLAKASLLSVTSV